MENIPAQPPDIQSSIEKSDTRVSKRIFLLIASVIVLLSLLSSGFFLFQFLNAPQRQLEKAIKDYQSLNLRVIANDLYIDTFRSVRDGLINRALQANAALASGDKEKAREALGALKKEIEFQSRGDKATITEVNMDRNGNRITDYLEPFYDKIIQASERLGRK